MGINIRGRYSCGYWNYVLTLVLILEADSHLIYRYLLQYWNCFWIMILILLAEEEINTETVTHITVIDIMGQCQQRY